MVSFNNSQMEIFGYDQIILENPGNPKRKISHLWFGKTWQAYITLYTL